MNLIYLNKLIYVLTLLLDLNDQLPSPIDHQGSIENSTTKEKPKPLMSLRVRCLPGDKLSLRKLKFEN